LALLLSTACVERIIVDREPEVEFASEEELCDSYCTVINDCSPAVYLGCWDQCLHPLDTWPWLTEECLEQRRVWYRCVAPLTCEEYSLRSEDEARYLCRVEEFNWEALNYECFGQYTETDGPETG